jgi:hypothetical protein
VLQALEIDPPKGAQAIQWTLLANWKIDSLKTARRLVRWYAVRWGIECWHQVLKDVCKVETRQMKSAEALGRALGLDMIVAWRVLLLCRLGKEHPHLPASLLYSPEELAILEVLKKKDPSPLPAACAQPSEPVISEQTLDEIRAEVRAYQKASDPTLADGSVNLLAPARSPSHKLTPCMTMWEANCLTAQLAGFWGRKADGHPGPDVLGRGLLVLAALVRYERIKIAQQQSRAHNPRRKPG